MSKDELPSISDYGKDRDDLPSYKDFLEKKEENLPSVEDFIEKKVVEETQTIEDLDGNSFLEVTDVVSAPDWSQLVRLINDVRKDIPEIPEIKYYDEELEKILQNIEEIKGNIPEVVYYDQDISSLKEEIGQVKNQIPEVPEVRYYEGDIEYIHTKINLVKEEIARLPEVKYYDEDVESLRNYIGEVKESIPTFPDWVNQVEEVPDFSWIGKTFSCIDDDFNKVQGHLDLIRDKIKFEVSDLNETIETKEFEFKVDLKNLEENVKETKDRIWKELRETSTRIWDHHNEYKDDDRKLKKQILGEYNQLKQKVKQQVEDYNKENSKYQESLLTKFKFVEERVDNLDIRYYDEDIENIQKDVKSVKTDISTLFTELNNIAEEIKTNQQELKENYLLSEPPEEKQKAGGQSDPLTPIGEKFATFKDLEQHYRLFLNRIQVQMATMGGGGAGFVKDLDDVEIVDISNHDVIVYDSSTSKYKNEPGVQRLLLDVRNNSGSTITAGTPVYQTGYNSGQDRINVSPADASDASTMPAKGVLFEDLDNNTNGYLIVSGEVEGVDTSDFNVADELFVAVGGGLTVTKPTGATESVQKIATVLKKSASQGALLVHGAGRVNDVPNQINIVGVITAGGFFNTDGTEVGGVGAAGTWGVDSVGINTIKNVGIGTTTAKAGKALFVVGDGEFTGNVSVAGTLTYEDVTNIDSVGLVTARTGVRIVGGGLTVTGVSTFHSDVSFESNIIHTGIATFGSSNGIGTVHIGIGTTALLVDGNARVTGILTVGKDSITLDPNARLIKGIDEVIIGSATTISIRQDAAGEIEFADSSGKQTSVGIGTTVSINTTGIITASTLKASTAFYPPTYTTTDRDAGTFNEGAMIYNSSTKKLEFYDGTNWNALPGVSLGLAIALDG
jgi:hypothetical protein